MTHDLMLLIAQTACVFFLTAWLSTGVYENVFTPISTAPSLLRCSTWPVCEKNTRKLTSV